MVVSRSPEGKPTRMIGTHTDITAQKKSEDALQSSLREKVALLNEVHHRVKNNLQVITSLLRLEARRSAQADTKVVLGEMQGRIRSMAVLHESLYRSGIFASVDLGAYLKNLGHAGVSRTNESTQWGSTAIGADAHSSQHGPGHAMWTSGQ
jgi:two-component sensor histidine kinase